MEILLSKWTWIAVLAIALLGTAAWATWHAYTTIDASAYQRGYNARVAEEVKAAADAAFATAKRDQDAAQASQAFHKQVDAQIPQIEETTHAAQDKVRIIYRDHPVPAQCVRPDGVLQQLEAARSAANAAAGATAH